MKIDSSVTPLPSANVSEIRARSAGAATTAAKTGGVSDVQLSELSSHLQTSTERAPVDDARVAEIKQAIAEGRFQVNAGAIADRLISSARELVGTQRRA